MNGIKNYYFQFMYICFVGDAYLLSENDCLHPYLIYD